MVPMIEDNPLTIHVFSTPSGVVVEMIGTADINALSAMRSALLQAARNTRTETNQQTLIVDMRRVDYVDSAGLSALVAVAKALTPHSESLHILVSEGGQPDRALRLVRFDTIMSVIHEPPVPNAGGKLHS